MGKKFLIGAATSAHQVEGNNTNSDYWIMEQLPGSNFIEPSLDAVNHYNLYKEDIQMLAEAGHNTYRFSIEWARIEPEKGTYDENEINHYREVLLFCHKHNITPIVTLHHFSSPKWLITEGGWESEKTVSSFRKYAAIVTENLGDLIPYICTINEANMGKQIMKLIKNLQSKNSSPDSSKQEVDLQIGLNNNTQMEQIKLYNQYLEDTFRIKANEIFPFLSPRSKKGEEIIMECHRQAREAIKQTNSKIKVGLTLSLYDHQAVQGGEKFVEQEQYDDFLCYLPYIKEDDFLGVQNYTRKVYGENGVIEKESSTRVTKMGYEYYPQALGNVIRFVNKYWKNTIIVTENGISTDSDHERMEFISEAINGLKSCIDDGIPVEGYLYWSLFDNFEWQLGYQQTFGLVGVDRKNQKRHPKESLNFVGKILDDISM